MGGTSECLELLFNLNLYAYEIINETKNFKFFSTDFFF